MWSKFTFKFKTVTHCHSKTDCVKSLSPSFSQPPLSTVRLQWGLLGTFSSHSLSPWERQSIPLIISPLDLLQHGFLIHVLSVAVPRNYDPALHPFEVAREYTRALNATKLERLFAKPFLSSLDGHRDGVNCMAKHPKSLSTVLSGACDGEVSLQTKTKKVHIFLIFFFLFCVLLGCLFGFVKPCFSVFVQHVTFILTWKVNLFAAL